MTEAAYLAGTEAGYERTFTATVVSRPPGAIVLDRTFFYPVGGGQPADRGWLTTSRGERVAITDVRKSGEAIVHALAKPAPGVTLPAPGERVEGEIDWARRHAHMRLHTAQHLLSALLFAQSGLRTRAAALRIPGATIDLESTWPSALPWTVVAESVGAELARARDVRIAFVRRAEWDRAPSARSGAVPLAPHVDPVRIIEIDDVDRCPCGGTHLRSTSEIGPMELSAPVPYAGGSRVGFTLRGLAAHSERVTP